MGLWTVQGGNRLYGTMQVQGAKNGVLPILAACLVHDGVSVLERVPRVGDVERTLDILRYLGCKVKREGDTVTVDSRHAEGKKIPEELTDGMRSSLLFLGAMAARFGAGSIHMPGDCRLGPRPIDLHVAALTAMGAQLVLGEEELCCEACQMNGGEVVFPFPSVGATEHAMVTACGCKGSTVLRNCATEPEVVDLAAYLNAMGAHVVGAGTETVTITSGNYKGTVTHRVMYDRIAAGALLFATAACGGKVTLRDLNCTHLLRVLDVLEEMGCNIKIRDDFVTLQSNGDLWSPTGEIVTGPYPQFPTDLQPMLLASALRADGVTVVRERVFPGRLQHAKQLRRFVGDVSITEDCSAIVTGVDKLRGTYAEARDLCGGAALIVAALQAEGESCIVDAGYVSRGFEFFDSTLRMMGARLEYSD